MAQLLQSILGLREPMFSAGMSRLERSTGHSAVDVRLIADIISKAHQVIRSLGLDVRDTTGRELYSALKASIAHGVDDSIFKGTDYVLVILDDKVISLNLIDIIENTHHELSYEKQIISHGQRSLRGELVGRYINHARTHEPTTREIAREIGLLQD
jgi:hypothetical protein